MFDSLTFVNTYTQKKRGGNRLEEPKPPITAARRVGMIETWLHSSRRGALGGCLRPRICKQRVTLLYPKDLPPPERRANNSPSLVINATEFFLYVDKTREELQVQEDKKCGRTAPPPPPPTPRRWHEKRE